MTEKIEHLWTVLCKEIRNDEHGLSLVGLMDMVTLPNLPQGEVSLQLRCFVVSNWRRNLEPGATIHERLQFEYLGDKSRVLLTGPNPVVLEAKHLFCTITQIDVLPIRGYGQYMFVVQRQDGEAWVDTPPTAGLWVAASEGAGGKQREGAPPSASGKEAIKPNPVRGSNHGADRAVQATQDFGTRRTAGIVRRDGPRKKGAPSV
jgi:hypothetical protein